MAYASVDDVLARAGRFAGLFSEDPDGKRPNQEDLGDFLDTVAAQIDAEILRRGYATDSLSDEVTAALLDVNAWAVLVRALPEASPGDAATVATVERGVAILKAAGFPGLAEGGVEVWGIIGSLEAGAGGGGAGTSAGSLWDELVAVQDDRDETEIGEAAEPSWLRGQSL